MPEHRSLSFKVKKKRCEEKAIKFRFPGFYAFTGPFPATGWQLRVSIYFWHGGSFSFMFVSFNAPGN